MVFLSPRSDLVFKKLFGTPANKELTISFLNSVLGREEGRRIVDVSFNDPNNHLELLRQKFSIVDVRCTDERGHQYIIEMQNQDQHDFVERAQYYGACGVSVQLEVAERYGTLMPVILVGIVDYVLFPRHKRYISHHHNVDQHDKHRDLDLNEYVFIELPKFEKEVTQEDSLVDKWIYFLKYADIKKEIPASLTNIKPFQNAFHILTQSAWTVNELELYKRQVDALRVEKSVLETAKIEGLDEGRHEGRQEGRQEAKLELARNMLSEKIDIETISKITGLAVEKIKKL